MASLHHEAVVNGGEKLKSLGIKAEQPNSLSGLKRGVILGGCGGEFCLSAFKVRSEESSFC